MIRVFIDDRGDGHDDIFLKIGALPPMTQIGDLYFMSDFLKLDPDKTERVPQDLAIAYIDYLKSQFKSLSDTEKFIAFDLSDQYIGGLLVTKNKNGLLKVKYVWTDKISGYSVDKDSIDEKLNKIKPDFSCDHEWLISSQSVFENLNWSIDKINH